MSQQFYEYKLAMFTICRLHYMKFDLEVDFELRLASGLVDIARHRKH